MSGTCKDCTYWHPYEGIIEGEGDCCLHGDPNTYYPLHGAPYTYDCGHATHPESKASAVPFAGTDGASFITEADFGCNQFEVKQ